MLYVVCLAVMLVSPLMAMGVDEDSPVITRDDLALSMWEYAQRAHLPSFADDGSLALDKAVS